MSKFDRINLKSNVKNRKEIKVMSSSEIPSWCSEEQKKKLREYLHDGWTIDDIDHSDDSVLIKKGFAYRYVFCNGDTCAA